MLKLTVKVNELWDDAKQEFNDETVTLRLEHSLVSLSKWEGIFEKPFLGEETKTSQEVKVYVECMIIDEEFPPEVFSALSEENFSEINDYINAKSTATWFTETTAARRSREVITAELIYYWMVTFSIPFECQYWHLNRLFTLIRVCNEKNQKPKKVDRKTAAEQRRALNAKRRQELGTNG